MGFGEVLHLDDCCIPRSFVQWFADNVLPDEEVIQLGSKSILLSPQSVSDTFGTPAGELHVDSDEEIGKSAFLAVRCLDFVDFNPIEIPSTLPRIRVWKGNLIKVFSDMFIGTNGKYVAYPIRDISETCYSRERNKQYAHVRSDAIMKQSMYAALGHLVDNKLKEDISQSFKRIMKDEDDKICIKAQELVVHVVQAFASNKIGSQDTLKLTCSKEGSDKTAIDSRSTVKLPSSDEEHDNDDGALIHRKRRCIEVKTSSHQSTHPETAMKNDERTILAPIIKDVSGTANVFSQPVHSPSLAYMLPVNNCSNNGKDGDDVSSKEDNKLKSIKIDLKRICIEEDNEGFSGFNAPNSYQCSEHNMHSGNGGCSALVMNEPNINNNVLYLCSVSLIKTCTLNIFLISVVIYDVCTGSQAKCTIPTNRGEYLEKARLTYFFKDNGLPTFRLVEDEDDNGKTIEEPELFRPLGMDDYTYNMQVEQQKQRQSDKSSTGKPERSSLLYSQYQCCADMWTSSHISKHKRPANYEDAYLVTQTNKLKVHLASIHERVYTNSCTYIESTSHVLMCTRCSFPELAGFTYTSISKLAGFTFTSRSTELVTSSDESSPEVQILGEKSFKSNCNIMNEKAEELYNTSLSLGSSSSRYGKENVLPQRIPQRSKYICSPFDVNASPRVALQPIEVEIWEAVTTLCDIEPHRLSWAINIDNIRVSMLQLGSSMKVNGWVEAGLMNAFCRKLFRDNHPRKMNKHFFFNTTSIRKWKNEETRVIWKHRAIESFILSNKARALHLSDGIKNFKIIWNEAGLKNLNFQTYGIAYPNVPKQKTGNDCGIFGMKCLERFCARNPAQCTFSHLDIPAF
ncbi:hypothetical protein ACQ4PT_023761 [Festuca glaucescens]